VAPAAAQGAAPAQSPQADPTWKWSDDRIADFWGRLSAGRSLKPATWPSGARVAVALSFDYQRDGRSP